MQNIIYCPVCGTNIRSRKICPACRYELARDYEMYPTLGSIPGNTPSFPAIRQEWERQRLQKVVYELWEPLRSEIQEQTAEQTKQQFAELERKFLHMDAEEIHAADIRSDSPSSSQSQHKFITITNNICTFGSYPQDADGTVRPILWRVLEIDQENHKALLLSDKILDCKAYYTSYVNINWDKAGDDIHGLRYWLNHGFFQEAFPTEAEKSIILTTTVEPHVSPNPKYQNDQGKAVQDKIFLLSAQEVIQYFSKSRPEIKENTVSLGGNQAAAKGTEYAKKNTGLSVNKGYSSWWLRSLGSIGSCASFVNGVGGILLNGYFVNQNHVGVRPALWVNLEDSF